MTPDAPAADNAFLSIEQAVANLDALPDQEEDEAPAETAQPEKNEAEPAAEDASEPEAVTDGDDAETEEGTEEAEEAELPPIEPPRFWDADKKALFAGMSRELQEYVLAKETERDKATSKALQEASDKRKAADGEASRIAQLNGVLDKLIPQANDTFKSRWENVDWDKVVDQYGADQALKLKNQMETERNQLQQLHAAKEQADAATTGQFISERFDQLKTVCPELVDGKAGEERQLKLVNFLTESTKIPAEHIVKRASADELSIAYDAMLYRQAKADAKAKSEAPPKALKPAGVARPSVKATAAPTAAGSPVNARIQQLMRKPHRTVDEAVELMDLQEQ